MIVVSDTAPLNYLILLNVIEVLPKLYPDIYVPPAVLQELQHPRAPDIVRRWAFDPPKWLHVRAPISPLQSAIRLDLGESQALSLAGEMQAAGVIIDEKKGRQVARTLGFVVLGTVTVLEVAAAKNLLDLSAAIHALRGTTYQIADEFLKAALARDAARRQNRPAT